jgi:hypothetical protein
MNKASLCAFACAAVAVVAATTFAAPFPANAANDGPELTRVPYNSTRIPLLACSVVLGCEIVLQAGEQLRLASLNDDRWSAKVVDQASPDGIGRQPLQTAFHALTDHREYVINLRAIAASEQHRLGFTYDDGPAVIVRAPAPIAAGPQATAVPVVAPESETPPLDPARIDFGWKATGSPEIRCSAVFSYDRQLWCKLPPQIARTPVAYYADGKKDEPLNTHMVAQRYLVVDSLAAPIALELGGAHSARVVIERARE